MATRSYKRDSKGRFKGGGGGRVTYGRAGGFANAAHSAKVRSGYRSPTRLGQTQQRANRLSQKAGRSAFRTAGLVGAGYVLSRGSGPSSRRVGVVLALGAATVASSARTSSLQRQAAVQRSSVARQLNAAKKAKRITQGTKTRIASPSR